MFDNKYKLKSLPHLKHQKMTGTTRPLETTEMTTFPAFPEYLEGSFDVFYSPKGAEEFYQDVINACLDMYGTILIERKSSENVSINAAFRPYNADTVFIKLYLYTKEIDGVALSVVYYRKDGSGDLFEFAKICKAFIKQIDSYLQRDRYMDNMELQKNDSGFEEEKLSNEIELLP